MFLFQARANVSTMADLRGSMCGHFVFFATEIQSKIHVGVQGGKRKVEKDLECVREDDMYVKNRRRSSPISPQGSVVPTMRPKVNTTSVFV